MNGEPGVGKQSNKRRKCDETSDDDDGLILKLSDKSVLDCPICYNPLTTPVFQCIFGHIICSSCLGTLKPKSPLKPKRCPSCSRPLGNIRNRAIETILESIRLPCFYEASGCSAQLTYPSKLSHEQTCAYAPYDCPFKDCNFSGPHSKLYPHFKNQHSTSVLLNSFDTGFSFDLCTSKSDELVALLKKGKGNEGFIFIFDATTMSVSSILDPILSKVLSFRCSLRVKHKSITFSSPRVIRPRRNTDVVAAGASVGSANSNDDDLVPLLEPFYDHDGRIRLHLTISCYYDR